MPDEISRTEPPYLQIARHYRDLIERGDLRPGEQLPSVREMAERWKVAHTTAARALKALQAEGLAASTVGTGTVVADRSAGSPTAEALAGQLRQSGTVYPPGYSSTILAAAIIPAPDQVADVLGVERGEPVIGRSRIVRDEAGRPAESSMSYVRGELADVAPALLTTEPLSSGVLGYLEQQTGRRAEQGVDQYAARAASPEEAAALNLAPGSPVLMERHWTIDGDGEVLEYAESVEPGQRWRTRRYRT